MNRIHRWTLLFCVACTASLYFGSQASAQATFWDWLHGRTPEYTPGGKPQPPQPAAVPAQPAAYGVPNANANANPALNGYSTPAPGYSTPAPGYSTSAPVAPAPAANGYMIPQSAGYGVIQPAGYNSPVTPVSYPSSPGCGCSGNAAASAAVPMTTSVMPGPATAGTVDSTMGYAPTITGYAPTTMGYAPTAMGYAPTGGCSSCGSQAAVTPAITGYAPVMGYAPASGYAAYAPQTPAMPTAIGGYGQSMGFSPVAGYSPAMGCSSCGMQAAVPTTVGYASAVAATPGYVPTVRYRTTLARVPVTYYRPVTASDPATGYATTAMQACTTYRWQLQRVPAGRSGCGLFSWLHRDEQAASVPVAAPMITGVPTYDAVNAAPCTPVSPGYEVPGATMAPGPTLAPGPASSVPADTAPSLQPQSPTQGSAYRYQGGNSGSVLGPTPAAPAPEKTTAEKSGKPDSADNVPLTAPNVGGQAAQPAEQRSAVDPGSLHQPTFVKPVPDPDKPAQDPPSLLPARERTASRVSWDVVPISWPTPVPQPKPTTQLKLAAPPAPAPVRWDDSGWRSQPSH